MKYLGYFPKTDFDSQLLDGFTMNEGYIKFNIDHSFQKIDIPHNIFESLTYWRTKLFDLGLIGETPEGIGFGNISIKSEYGFFITGSATGGVQKLGENGYAFVSGYDFDKNKVKSQGPVKSSSESLSHAAIYECNREIGAVIHIHNELLWKKYLNRKPTTSKNVAFGTPEMAYEIQILLSNEMNLKESIFITAGHRDGIFTFGKDLNDAGARILKFHNN